MPGTTIFLYRGIIERLLPKYRRQIIYGKYKAEIGKILRTICERYEVEIIEANACKDHIHMLVSVSYTHLMCIRDSSSALRARSEQENKKSHGG